VWEVAKKVEKQQLTLDRPVRDWVDLALRQRGLAVADLSPEVLIESCSLPQPFHGDPADQIIVATARHLQATLVTKDERLLEYAHVPSTW
jgi:PIN domain nuclease of toxin-antitoxin system